jgi:DNA-binding CsgD family transcriptional regulator
MACKNGGTKHNWIVSEKDHDFDVCTECGATRDTKKFDTRRGLVDIEINEPSDNWYSVEQIEDEIDASLSDRWLSPKQAEVSKMLRDGYNQSEIAKELGKTPQAINDRIKTIKNKLPF